MTARTKIISFFYLFYEIEKMNNGTTLKKNV